MLVSGERIFLIDFEVVHWGDAAFDAGFLLNHLALKAFHRPGNVDRYIQTARDFWERLRSGLGGLADGRFERMTLRHLGALMLARIDGKSPVEYIRDEATKDRVRRVAMCILLETPGSIEEVWSIVRKGIVEK
jgi:5-methylthioribose kinase